MTIFQAMILGVVQGLTEFLPISSQAHLYLVPYFLGWNYQGLGFDIGLHMGTLAAVLFVFWKDYLRITKSLFTPSPRPSSALPTGRQARGEGDRRLAWYLVLGSIPAAVLGFLFEKQAETTFRNPLITVFTLAGFGLLLWYADRKFSSTAGVESLNSKKVLGIGAAQAIAIVPGVSRSGATITAGLFAGLSREAAARFSFLLSGPIIFGAGLVALKDLVIINTALIAGFIAAAVSGIIAIKFLLKYLTSHNLNIFVWYRVILAGIILISLVL